MSLANLSPEEQTDYVSKFAQTQNIFGTDKRLLVAVAEGEAGTGKTIIMTTDPDDELVSVKMEGSHDDRSIFEIDQAEPIIDLEDGEDEAPDPVVSSSEVSEEQ